jgi:hypothetical protein
MDVNLTGALAANVSLMPTIAKTDYSALLVASAGLVGVIISQFFEWVKRRDDETKESRKRIFQLKKEAYYDMINVIEDYTYAYEHKSQEEKDIELARLELAAYKVQLSGSEKVASLIKESWDKLGSVEFVEDELIPALKEDIQRVI